MRTIHELLRETAEKKLNAARVELRRLAPEPRRRRQEQVGIQAGGYRTKPAP